MKRQVTKDGNYHLNKHKASRSAVYSSGDLGGGTIELWVNTGPDSTAVPLKDEEDQTITMAEATQREVNHGTGVALYAKLSGSTTPNIMLVCEPLS